MSARHAKLLHPLCGLSCKSWESRRAHQQHECVSAPRQAPPVQVSRAVRADHSEAAANACVRQREPCEHTTSGLQCTAILFNWDEACRPAKQVEACER